MDVAHLFYQKEANYYICLPGEYAKFEKVILEDITLKSQNKMTQPSSDKFMPEP